MTPPLPSTLRILLENLRRHAGSGWVRPEHLDAVRRADTTAEVPFLPSRVLLQDYTAVPAFADLAAMRDAVRAAGGDPLRVNPALPVQVVVDHSLIVEAFGRADARSYNTEREYARNAERYRFLRWVQGAFRDTLVVPPGAGIVHQVNVEQLTDVVTVRDGQAFPDTVLGADSHTTMVNGLGVLGWGVGGIEAEAIMLGEPVYLRVPQVVGVELTGELPDGATATDLVLTLTELLRSRDVVGKFVEFHGTGLATLPAPDRMTVANMSPEFGSTCAYFPIDGQTLRYLRDTGRSADHVARVESFARGNGLWHGDAEVAFTEHLRVDLARIRPSVAGPSRPDQRVDLAGVRRTLRLPDRRPGRAPADGSVAIAALTSCTNTANPGLMVGAGLVARNAVRRGLRPRPWVKTSLAPGSTVVVDYLRRAGLTDDLSALGFHLVGFGCTTCIGNSGPLAGEVADGIARDGIAVAAVLSGNRNFEGRVHPDVRFSFLASPPLVVAYAIAGTVDIDLTTEPLGTDEAGRPVFLRDLWPPAAEVAETLTRCLRPGDYVAARRAAVLGDSRWRDLPRPAGEVYAWDPASTYVRRPPFAAEAAAAPSDPADIRGARVLAVFGDGITTDHISPSGGIPERSPAGRYLTGNGVAPEDFNSYGARRANHEVGVRAAFANRRLRNRLVNGEGGWTRHHPSGDTLPIHDAATRYAADGVPLVILAGHRYGAGSSRDWAAKGTRLLGVRAVIAGSFERIHRTNLVGMGVLPLQFRAGESVSSHGLTGEETVTIAGLEGFAEARPPATLRVTAGTRSFDVLVRIDTTQEATWYRHGGIIPYVMRRRWL